MPQAAPRAANAGDCSSHGDILGFEEVLNPADIEPEAVVLEDVHGCVFFQHLEHQIVKAEWNARRNAFEY